MPLPKSRIASLVGRVAVAKDASFHDLISLAKIDPRVDFRNADLSGVDFGAMDIAGFDFTNANLTGCNFARVTGLAQAVVHGAELEDALLPTGNGRQSKTAQEKREESHRQYVRLREKLEYALDQYLLFIVEPLEQAFQTGELRIFLRPTIYGQLRNFDGPGRSTMRIKRFDPIQPRQLNINIVIPRSFTSRAVAHISAAKASSTRHRVELSTRLRTDTGERAPHEILCYGLLEQPFPKVTGITYERMGEGQTVRADRAWLSLSPLDGWNDFQKSIRRMLARRNPRGSTASRLGEAAFKFLSMQTLAPRSDGRMSIDVSYGNY